jgi:hypothetical protein
LCCLLLLFGPRSPINKIWQKNSSKVLTTTKKLPNQFFFCVSSCRQDTILCWRYACILQHATDHIVLLTPPVISS